MAIRSTLFTIHPGSPFLATLVEALLDGTLVEGFSPRGDPLALAGVTIFLPTRRSIRVLRETFLEALGGEAAILPRLLALGEVDDEEAAFDEAADLVALPEAVGGMERQVALTRLVLEWAQRVKTALLPLPGRTDPLLIPASPGDAARLATALAGFMDGLETERIPFERLEGLKGEHEGRHDRYFDLTLHFLTIVTRHWPAQLADWGKMDPVARRNRLIEGETARFSNLHRDGPVIVAGSTGSIPATRDLIAAVARHPRGAVVLPGLDLELDEAGWNAIPGEDGDGAPSHPQAGLQALLRAIGVARDGVTPLGAPSPARVSRIGLVSQALRPAATTDAWIRTDRPSGESLAAALEGLTLVEAATEAEEALSLAVLLREALETPGRRAALVTPDRGLAGRVVAELARWGIRADDSAGRALLATPPGILARLVLDCALEDFAPVPLLALLKNPLCALALPHETLARGMAALEIAVLRGPVPPPGLAGLRQVLAEAHIADIRRAPRALKDLKPADLDAAATVLDALDAALSPFAEVFKRSGEEPASALFEAHTAAILAAADNAALADGDAGAALVEFLADLARIRPHALALPAAAYPGLFFALATGRSVRGGDPAHPRLAIYGLLEARLIPVDRLVLSGLDEGVWPATVAADPWLNRPMRASLGLTAPERRIGLAAHDFAQGLGAEEVFVTRALKRGGSPTVPARWLQRLAAFIGKDAYAAIARRGLDVIALARRLDAPAAAVPPPRPPAPCPPLHLRPSSLSVTEIEHLQRDPYTIYARHILALQPLDAIALAPGAADRGTLLHKIAEDFATLCTAGVPADAAARLTAIIDAVFAPFAFYPDVSAFWLPRARNIARFLLRWEAARRPNLAAVKLEARGGLTWTTRAGRRFDLRAKADRIETLTGGSLRIVDFKTGAPPSVKQVDAGFSPQLPLEVAMVLEGGFGLPATEAVEDSLYVHLHGKEDGGVERPLTFEAIGTVDHARHSLARLKGLIDRFENEDQPYRSMLHPMFKGRRYGDFDHLARVREWSLAGEDGEGEA